MNYFLAFVVVLLSACSTQKPRPLLWEIEHKDKKSYLFGTLHSLDLKSISPEALKAFKKSKSLTVETDTRSITPKSLKAFTELHRKVRLSDFISHNDFLKLKDYLKIPSKNLERFQPWWASILLSLPKAKPNFLSMDQGFHQESLEQKKRINHLEGWEFQYSTISQLSTAYDLKKQINNIGEVDNQVKQIEKAYIDRDIEKLEKLTSPSAKSQLKDYQYYLMQTNRNLRWIPKILELIKKETTFIAVGVAHLLGEKGLISLLRENGIKVKRSERQSKK